MMDLSMLYIVAGSQKTSFSSCPESPTRNTSSLLRRKPKMPPKEFVLIEKQMVAQVISTLKALDVRGYNSMNSLVGMVMLFENLLSSPPISLGEEKKPEKEG